MNIDFMPVPELACPQCGATNWRHFDLPDNTCFQHQSLQNCERLIDATVYVFIALGFLFIFPALQELALIAVGMLLCLAPSIFFFMRLGDHIKSTLHLCDSCGFFSSE